MLESESKLESNYSQWNWNRRCQNRPITDKHWWIWQTTSWDPMGESKPAKGPFIKFNVAQKTKLVIIFPRPPPPPKNETYQCCLEVTKSMTLVDYNGYKSISEIDRSLDIAHPLPPLRRVLFFGQHWTSWMAPNQGGIETPMAFIWHELMSQWRQDIYGEESEKHLSASLLGSLYVHVSHS